MLMGHDIQQLGCNLLLLLALIEFLVKSYFQSGSNALRSGGKGEIKKRAGESH